MSLNLELHSPELFYPVLENINDGILITDSFFNILFINQKAANILGIKPQDILKKNAESVNPIFKLNLLLQNKEQKLKSVESINNSDIIVTRGLIGIESDSFICYIILHKQEHFADEHMHLFLDYMENTMLKEHRKSVNESLNNKHQNGTAKYCFNHIVGNNQSLIQQKELASKAARTISTVLITGESGTGKEMLAHAIHNLSPRRHGPFIKVNSAAVPEPLLESELFGYAEGAFTGALKEGKPGKFELAEQGTIFLDEIADMSITMQAKLLRVLQERELERVGAVRTTKVNVRVIAATNKDLLQLVAQNKFREDLFYRLNVIVLNLCPLRERIDDIEVLCNAILRRLNHKLDTHIETIDDEVIEHFANYEWPGNVRELENTIERAINFSDGNTISISHIPVHIISSKTQPGSVRLQNTLETILEQYEKEVISSTLHNCAGNKSRAAKALNIHRSVLYRKISKYNINL
ncbi:MAG: sigma 54-interacting transcriptional regulator [Syntrophomonadaceae bacterium]|nr:sigma 54-interacting transcriptional regulator [Syntrophomonadaceae bacterium]